MFGLMRLTSLLCCIYRRLMKNYLNCTVNELVMRINANLNSRDADCSQLNGILASFIPPSCKIFTIIENERHSL